MNVNNCNPNLKTPLCWLINWWLLGICSFTHDCCVLVKPPLKSRNLFRVYVIRCSTNQAACLLRRFHHMFTAVSLDTRWLTLMWFLTTLHLCSLWSSGIPISSQISFRWHSALFRQDTASAASTSLQGRTAGDRHGQLDHHINTVTDIQN